MLCTCDICNKQFARSDSLKRHKRLKHTNTMFARAHPEHARLYARQAIPLPPKVKPAFVEYQKEVKTTWKNAKNCTHFHRLASATWDLTAHKWEKAKRMALKELNDEDASDAAEQKNDDESDEVAFAKMQPEQERIFFDKYRDFLMTAMCVKNSKLHRKVLAHASELQKMGVTSLVAAQTAIEQFEEEFDVQEYMRHVYQTRDDEEVDDSSDSSNEEEDEDEEDDEEEED